MGGGAGLKRAFFGCLFAGLVTSSVACGHHGGGPDAKAPMGHLEVKQLESPDDAPEAAKTVQVAYVFDRDIANKDFDKSFKDGFEKKGVRVDSEVNAHAHFDVKNAKITGTVTYVKKKMGRFSIIEANLVAEGHYDADVQVDVDVKVKGDTKKAEDKDWEGTAVGGKPFTIVKNVMPTNIPIAGPLFLHAHFDLTAACELGVEGRMHATTGVGIRGDVRLAARYKKAGFDKATQDAPAAPAAPAGISGSPLVAAAVPAPAPAPSADSAADDDADAASEGSAPTEGSAAPAPAASAAAPAPAAPQDNAAASNDGGKKKKKSKFQFEAKAPNFELAPKPYLKVEGKQQSLKGKCSLQPTAVLLLEHSIGAKLSVEPWVELDASRPSSKSPWKLDAQAGVSVNAATDIEIFGRQLKKPKEYTLYEVALTKPGDALGAPPPSRGTLIASAANTAVAKAEADVQSAEDAIKKPLANASRPINAKKPFMGGAVNRLLKRKR